MGDSGAVVAGKDRWQSGVIRVFVLQGRGSVVMDNIIGDVPEQLPGISPFSEVAEQFGLRCLEGGLA